MVNNEQKDNTAPLVVGDFVQVSDGTPKPPKHHTKKVAYWEQSNFSGHVHSIDGQGRISVDPDGRGIMVFSVNPNDLYVVRVNEKEQPTAA